MPVGQRTVAQSRIGPEAQHPAGKLLVVDVQYLGVVVRICQDDPAAGADHPQQLVQHPGRFSDVLQDPVGPGTVELTRYKRQPVPVRDSDVRQSSVPCLRDHCHGAVDRDDLGPTARAQGHGGVPGTRSDLKKQSAGLGTQELLQPLLVSSVERLRTQPVQHLNPLGGPGLRVHRRETVSNTVIIHGSTLATKPVHLSGQSTSQPLQSASERRTRRSAPSRALEQVRGQRGGCCALPGRARWSCSPSRPCRHALHD